MEKIYHCHIRAKGQWELLGTYRAKNLRAAWQECFSRHDNVSEISKYNDHEYLVHYFSNETHQIYNCRAKMTAV